MENLSYGELKRERSWIPGRPYFDDGVRKIDFVLVAKRIIEREKLDKMSLFMDNICAKGIDFECSRGIQNDHLIFIRLHGTDKFIRQNSDISNVPLQCEQPEFRIYKKTNFNVHCLHTILTQPNPNHEVYKRSPLLGKAPQEPTSAERILLMAKVIERAPFSEGEYDIGVEKLIKNGILVDAYPLHDGLADWTTEGPLNDRQLLSKYWASMACWLKRQPLKLIYKYYGAELAYYFAFIGFYNKMLIFAAIIGLVFFIYGVVECFIIGSEVVNDICSSDDMICPKCLNAIYCDFRPLSNFCTDAQLTCLFDISQNILYSVIITIWSCMCLLLWKRNEVTLRYQWNVVHVDADTMIRMSFYENTKYRKLSRYSGEMEPYVPCLIRTINYTITVIAIFLLSLLIVLAVIVSILVKIWMYRLFRQHNVNFLIKNSTLILMCTSSFINCMFMKILSPIAFWAAVKLTERENYRTWAEFQNACIYKSYILSFVNYYLSLFYLAFIRCCIYTNPADETMYYAFFGYEVETCSPAGCVISLTTQLLFILTLKTFIAHLFGFYIPFIKKLFKMKKYDYNSLPQWEADMYLLPNGPLYIIREYMELMIQYGLVTIFASVLSLSPFLALVSNLVELRTDAYKFIHRKRRVVPRRVSNIGAWNDLMRMITYLGTVTNALIIAFTSEKILLYTYYIHYDKYKKGLAGYYNLTFAYFSSSDLPTDDVFFRDVEICKFRGLRYDYDEPEKYTLTTEYWHATAYKVAFVVFFQQLVLLLVEICSRIMNKLSSSMRDTIYEDKRRRKLARNRYLKEFDTSQPDPENMKRFKL